MNATPSDRARGRPVKNPTAKPVSLTSGLLGSLRRDTAGNVMAMMAAFTIPLALLAGSAVDISRAYLVRVRLQQACDAGVLAGRKVMTQTTGTTLETAPNTAAEAFFKNNFPDGWMGTPTQVPTTFAATRDNDGDDAGTVRGTATITLPMTIMKMAGFTELTQTVTCSARLDIGDSDIMFVLDTTGSMACVTGETCANNEGSWVRTDVLPTSVPDAERTGYFRTELPNSKISQLRAAVKKFRTTLAASKPPAAHIRYGFVPYSSSVNVGHLIRAKEAANSATYLVSNAIYPSRELASNVYGSIPLTGGSAGISTNGTTTAPANYRVAAGDYNQGDINYGTVTTTPFTNLTRANCLAKHTRKSGTTDYAVGTWPISGTVTRVLPVSAVSAASSSTTTGNCTTYSWTVKPLWRYTLVSRSVSTFKTGQAVADPTKLGAPNTRWHGCIEERDTVAGATTFSPLPADLNPDTVPSGATTQWRPLWPEVVYYGNGLTSGLYANPTGASSDVASASVNASTGIPANFGGLLQGILTDNYAPAALYAFYGCNAQAKLLKEYETTAEITEFDSYLNGPSAGGNFRASGRTYHDVGMIWGLRLISPQGIWASTTAAHGGNEPPARYIVFMTDGILNTPMPTYSMYGMERLSARVSGDTSNTDAELQAFHALRFQAVCNAAKAKGITVFVVVFGVASVPANLESCATPGNSYSADPTVASTHPDSLDSAFSAIALQIARLRLSQ